MFWFFGFEEFSLFRKIVGRGFRFFLEKLYSGLKVIKRCLVIGEM